MTRHLRITINQEVYDVAVEVLNEAPSAVPAAVSMSAAAVAAPASSSASRPPAGSGDVLSPMAGKLVSFSVGPGQEVHVGDVLATVEAMKMNTYVHAETDGKVTALLAKEGDGVEEGQPLLRLG